MRLQDPITNAGHREKPGSTEEKETTTTLKFIGAFAVVLNTSNLAVAVMRGNGRQALIAFVFAVVPLLFITTQETK